MWKLFEQAFGRSDTEASVRDSESGDSGLGTRDSGFGNRDSQTAEPRPSAEGTPTKNEPAAQPPETAASEPAPVAVDVSVLEGQVKDALRTVYDPEIPINICELGLVYDLRVEPTGQVQVQMTLTAPSCPEAQFIPGRVEQAIREVPGVTDAKVELVWEPPWTPQKMSEAARLQLGIF